MTDLHSTRPGSSQLLSLADELILAIIEQIDTEETLRSLAATSPRFQALTEPFIWRQLLVLRGSEARKLCTALRTRPQRASLIQDLAIQYVKEHEAGIKSLNEFVKRMSKLRNLHIESPCPNNYGRGDSVAGFEHWTRIDYTKLFEDAVDPALIEKPLQMLQSFTLHGHRTSEQPFLFGRTAVLFYHPTLRHVTISCTNFDADILPGTIPQSKLHTTALQSLKFIECNVYLSLLEIALSLPKALKELVIGERFFLWEGCRPSDKTRPSHPDFLSVLQKQAHSLERLTHLSGSLRWNKHTGFDGSASKLHALSALEYLEVDTTSLILKTLGSMNACPDSLKTLKLTNAAFAGLNALHACHNIDNTLSMIQKLLPLLTNPIDIDLTFTFTSFNNYGTYTIDLLKAFFGGFNRRNPRRLALYAIVTTLGSRAANPKPCLRILAQTFAGSQTFIPPYMYGEEQPYELDLYDSRRDPWTFAGTLYQFLDMEFTQEEKRDKAKWVGICCEEDGISSRTTDNDGSFEPCTNCYARSTQCNYASIPGFRSNGRRVDEE